MLPLPVLLPAPPTTSTIYTDSCKKTSGKEENATVEPLTKAEWGQLKIDSGDDISDRLWNLHPVDLKRLAAGIKQSQELDSHQKFVIRMARYGEKCKELPKRS